jgi:hypothetical protein
MTRVPVRAMPRIMREAEKRGMKEAEIFFRRK